MRVKSISRGPHFVVALMILSNTSILGFQIGYIIAKVLELNKSGFQTSGSMMSTHDTCAQLGWNKPQRILSLFTFVERGPSW
jgi:hypothetical protein